MPKLSLETITEIAKESIQRIQRMIDDEFRVRGKKTVAELGDEELSWQICSDVLIEELNVQFATHDFENDDDAVEFVVQITKHFSVLTDDVARQMAVEFVADAKQNAKKNQR